MPEGPEIRRAAERIGRILIDRSLREVFFAFDRLKAFEDGLAGRRVLAVETRGKAMLTRFDTGQTLYTHNQLYGRWFTTSRGDRPDTRRSLRVALHTTDHSAWLYSASEIEMLDADGLARHPFLARLGPDLFDPGLGPREIAERLRREMFRRRSLAALYLDQGFLAGLGNYLRSEILFLAGLDPRRRPVDLDEAEVGILAETTLEVPRRSFETGGVTLSDELAGSRTRRKRFWVFARAGETCYRCGDSVVREARGGRRLYRCPTCQA